MTTTGQRPEVSVLLTSWNTLDETRRCLESLHATAGDLAYDVVAVDNASRDGSAALLAADPRVRLIANDTNVGFAPAVNQAHRVARGELVLLLNSDVRLHPGTLRTMVDFLRDHPDVSGVSPLYLNPDGSLQQHYVQLPGLAACLGMWTALRRLPYVKQAHERFQLVGEDFSHPRELASGSCLLLRTSVLRPEAIFDESFPIYWNDAILTRDLQAAGRRLWMLPSAVVTHSRGASCRRLGPAIRSRHLLGGMVRWLQATQPAAKVAVFRAVLTADHLLKTLLGRTTTLGWSDLRAALRGDVGVLPDGDARDWAVVAPGTTPIPTRNDIRTLVIREQRVGRDVVVEQTGTSTWHATLPALVPLAGLLPPARWLDQRLAAARLRRWLDRHAGARTLHVDAAGSYLVGRLGEDVPTVLGTAAQVPEVARAS